MHRTLSGLKSLCVATALALVLGGCSNSPAPPISVGLTPSSAQGIDQGVTLAIVATVTNDKSLNGVPEGVSWTVTGAGSVSPATGPATTFTPTASRLTASQQATVTATSLADPTKTASVQITVNPHPAIPISQQLPNGTVGTPYSAAVALTGGTAPFQWIVYNGPVETGYEVGGSVPDGLTLDAGTGTISGTPAAAGTWYFEAAVTDADSANAVDGFLSIQINPASSVSANPVPFLNQPLVPAAASPGGGGLTLAVSGTGFVSGATVDFNGTPLTTTFVDSDHISATVPATDVATAQTASITVANPAPGGGASNPVYFQVAAPQTTVTFANAPNSPVQVNEPFGLAAADFNQDGKPDLAVTSGTKLAVLLSKGDGTFTPASGSPIPVPSPPYDDFGSPYVGPLTVGDFNRRGHPSLALGEFQSESAVILLGDGNGTFVPSSAVFANSPGMPMSAIDTADFNADGNLDLLFTSSFTGVSSVALGYGKGAFNSAGALPYIHGFPAGVAVGDFNRDGRLDAAVANGGSPMYPYSGVTVSLGNGDGTFAQSTGSPISLGQDLSAITAGDFNGDGKLDLAVSDLTGNALYILLGNGDGTFQTPANISIDNAPDAIVAGDFNNDGKLDLAIANDGDNTVALLLGNGNGTFMPASGSPYPVGKGPSALVAADFNGDGKLDLAVTNTLDGTGSLSILLQQ